MLKRIVYEQIAFELYNRLGIRYPHEIDIDAIADYLDFRIVRYPGGSMIYDNVIALDSRLSLYEQRADFFHEASHILLHDGNQILLPDMAIDYQEAKADHLALHLAAPDYMLLPEVEPDRPYMDQVPRLAYIFRLPNKFIRFRLSRLFRNIEAVRLSREGV